MKDDQKNFLKKEVRRLNEELTKVREDRQKFRDYFSSKLKWFIEIHGQAKAPEMKWLIEDMAKFFNRVEHWFW